MLTFRDALALVTVAKFVQTGWKCTSAIDAANLGWIAWPADFLTTAVFIAFGAVAWRLISGKNRWGW